MSILQKYFLHFRALKPLLFEAGEGWSILALPAGKQPEWDADLEFLREMEMGPAPEDEPPFVGGWVGFLSYEQGLDWVGIAAGSGLVPRMWWKYCDRGLAVAPDGELHWFGFAGEEVPELEPPGFEVRDFGPAWSFEEYATAFEVVQQKLREGETYQVNLSMDFVGEFSGDPFGLYAALFARNPAAMTFYAEDEDWAVASNSPERLFSLRGRQLRAEPVKGTVPHDADPQFLLRDPKSYAELTMIVDLLRNDLGRVARVGSVEVSAHQALMELKNVWHTYSVIEAELAETCSVADVLRASFPGGSITGCPKLRTMEIIAELEGRARGAYCGSAGYVSINGNADFNIMIRTATVQDGKVHFPAGGGVVVDSTAESEWEECLAKVGVMRSLAS